MSADNGIFYREIDGKWYAIAGPFGGPRTNQEYKTKAVPWDTLGHCLHYAHGLAVNRIPPMSPRLLIHDPEPQAKPDPLREVARAILKDAGTYKELRELQGQDAHGEGARLYWPIRPDHYRRLKELLST